MNTLEHLENTAGDREVLGWFSALVRKGKFLCLKLSTECRMLSERINQ